MQQAHQQFGSLDVVINNAGYGLFGAVEELEEQAVHDILDANLLGTLWVTQAALPLMRAQGSGHLIQLSSILGITSAAGTGIYSATKFAVEGLSEALYHEVKGFGIHVTLVEPNTFKTDFGGTSAVHSPTIAAYDQAKASLFALPNFHPDNYGEPAATVPAILQLVDAPNRRCACLWARPPTLGPGKCTPSASPAGLSGSPWPSGPTAKHPSPAPG